MLPKLVGRMLTFCKIHKAFIPKEPQYLSERLLYREVVSERITQNNQCLKTRKNVSGHWVSQSNTAGSIFHRVVNFVLDETHVGNTNQLCEVAGTVQERHITNRKCRDSEVQGLFGRSILMREMTVGVGKARHKVVPPLPALTGEAGSEMAYPSTEGT
ncbi:hypothetical protein J6590_049411 [Homalodisca vitripennis]|nr:hypothetical protein J6590_049411 [Homalodisca vitripennis]